MVYDETGVCKHTIHTVFLSLGGFIRQEIEECIHGRNQMQCKDISDSGTIEGGMGQFFWNYLVHA